jgi:hypothetical protein
VGKECTGRCATELAPAVAANAPSLRARRPVAAVHVRRARLVRAPHVSSLYTMNTAPNMSDGIGIANLPNQVRPPRWA